MDTINASKTITVRGTCKNEVKLSISVASTAALWDAVIHDKFHSGPQSVMIYCFISKDAENHDRHSEGKE